MQKVASADNRLIPYCACTKFVTRLASKINRQVCHQMAQVLREQKIGATTICSQDSRNALNQSRTGKNPVFLIQCPDFRTDLNGCWQRLLFAPQPTQRKCSLCSQGKEWSSYGSHFENPFKLNIMEQRFSNV